MTSHAESAAASHCAEVPVIYRANLEQFELFDKENIDRLLLKILSRGGAVR
jgi:hypothetical protein